MPAQVIEAKSLVAEVEEARARAVSFITANIPADGRIEPPLAPNWYYRLPWTLATCGERRLASAVLTWMDGAVVGPDGHLTEDAGQGYEEHFATYPLANIVMGASFLERYDIANRVIDRLGASFQDPETGGAYSEHPDHRRTGLQMLFPTAQLGMAALVSGRLEMARKAAGWFRMLWDAQPDLPESLYAGWDRSGLRTSWPADAVRGMPADFIYVTRLQEPRQTFYNPGIAAAFLGRYFMATGDQAALDLARRYLELSGASTERQYDFTESKQVCKFGWGAAVVYEASGDEAAKGWIERMARWFVDSQEEDGRWHNSPFLSPEPTLEGDLNVTIEFALHLSSILSALGAAAARAD
jgi:hypothetical protein